MMLPSQHLSFSSSQVFLSTRHGAWVMYRVADDGYPYDVLYIRRCYKLLHSLLPLNAQNVYVQRKLNARFNHALYGLKPKHG